MTNTVAIRAALVDSGTVRRSMGALAPPLGARPAWLAALAWLLVLVLTAGPAFAQEQPALTAFVDRDEVGLNEVITLTVRVDASLGNVRPSFEGLSRDFLQLGMATSNAYTNVNGEVRSWTEYRISLRPAKTGTLIIPSFRAAGQTTQPISVEVGEAARSGNGEYEDIFLDTEVDKDSVYVQEQLVFTVKLYYDIAFNQGAQLSPPEVDNAVVQQVGNDATYQEMLGGTRYNVVERTFVIFPQSSGELVVPPIHFQATVGGRFGVLQRQRGSRQVHLSSEAHTIEVKPVPQSFPGDTWLPAANLELTENWSGDTSELQTGESVTRNITLVAEGLSSSLLPSLEYVDIPGLKFYPDQPVREDEVSNDGVVSSYREGTAVVPSQPGDYELPEIRLPWWNTTTDSLEFATIPARTLQVAANPATRSQATPPAEPASPSGSAVPDASPESGTEGGFSRLWMLIALAFAAAWLATTLLWLRQHRQRQFAGLPGARPAGTGPLIPGADEARRRLRASCEAENLPQVRRAVIEWGQAFFANPRIRSLDDLKAYCDSPTLSALLFNLDQVLYGDARQGGEFRCGQLLKEVDRLHREGPPRRGQSRASAALPPLYRN